MWTLAWSLSVDLGADCGLAGRFECRSSHCWGLYETPENKNDRDSFCCALCGCSSGESGVWKYPGSAPGSAWGSSTSYFAGRTVAQTFTAGITGPLDHIDVYIDAFFEPSNYPATVEIRGTANGSPTTQVLSSGFFPNGFPLGWTSISFPSQNPVLTTSAMYAIVFSDDDTTPTTSPTNGVAVRWDPASYPAGQLLVSNGTDWQPLLLGGSPATAGDMAFRTWMVPEPGTAGLLGVAASALLFRRRAGLSARRPLAA